jgi:hypothetical protein
LSFALQGIILILSCSPPGARNSTQALHPRNCLDRRATGAARDREHGQPDPQRQSVRPPFGAGTLSSSAGSSTVASLAMISKPG